MKRLTMIAAFLALAGCDPRTSDSDSSRDPVRYQDHETGCMYLTTGQKHALIPRIAADGKTHMGCKASKP